MKHARLAGKTITPMTLGTVQLGLEYGIANKNGKPDKTASFGMLQTALDQGVHCFDTAGSYGNSERILGEYLASAPTDAEVTIVTKIRIGDARNLTRGQLQRHINQEVEQSLENLRISRIPVLLLHQPDDLRDCGDRVTALLGQLKRDGLVDAIGVSLDSNADEQYAEFWPIFQDELYEAIQIPLNVLDQRLIHNGALRNLAAAGKVVFARSLFLKGLFFLADEELPQGIKAEAVGPLRIIHGFAEREGMSLAQLLVAYVRDMAEIDSLVIGAETVEQLQNNVQLMKGPQINEQTRAEMVKTLGDVPSRLLMPKLWH